MAVVRAILLAVVLGALTTTALSWCLALPPKPTGWVPAERSEWPGAVPGDWPAGGGAGADAAADAGGGAWIYEAETEGPGRLEREVRYSRESGNGSGVTVYAFDRASFGWPRLALCTDALEVMTAADGNVAAPPAVTRVWESALHRGVPLPLAERLAGHEIRLPVKVLWSGFVANTGLFGGGWGVLLAVRGAIGWQRRFRWRNRGCCEHCGYQVGGLAVCPECGKSRKA